MSEPSGGVDCVVGIAARLLVWVAPSTAQAKKPTPARPASRVRIDYISRWSANWSMSTASQSIVHTCRRPCYEPMHVLLSVRAVEALKMRHNSPADGINPYVSNPRLFAVHSYILSKHVRS